MLGIRLTKNPPGHVYAKCKIYWSPICSTVHRLFAPSRGRQTFIVLCCFNEWFANLSQKQMKTKTQLETRENKDRWLSVNELSRWSEDCLKYVVLTKVKSCPYWFIKRLLPFFFIIYLFIILGRSLTMQRILALYWRLTCESGISRSSNLWTWATMSKGHSVTLISITRSKYVCGTKDQNFKYHSYGRKV